MAVQSKTAAGNAKYLLFAVIAVAIGAVAWLGTHLGYRRSAAGPLVTLRGCGRDAVDARCGAAVSSGLWIGRAP